MADSPKDMKRAEYWLVVAVTAAALLATWGLDPIIGTTSPYVAFYFSSTYAAVKRGTRAGLLSLVLGATLGTLFIALREHTDISWLDEAVWLVVFVLFGGMVTVLGGRLLALRNVATLRAEELATTAAALQESEQRLRATYDSVAVGILEADTTYRFIAANDRICQILGYTREEMLGMTVLEVTHPEDREHTDAMNARLREGTAKTIHYEKRFLKRDGTPLWVHVTVSSVVGESGHCLRYVGTVEDISERRRSEAVLRSRLAAINAAADMVVITDASGTIEYVNPAFTKGTGYTEQEALGRNPRILKGGTQDEQYYRELWQTIRAGKVWQGQLVNRRKDGSLYTEEMTITPVLDLDGKVGKYIAIKRDITQRKAAEEALAAAMSAADHARETAEVANLSKDRFLAVLSHELRTPLTAVLPALDALTKHVSNKETEYLEIAKRNVELEARLIDDLLDVTRIANGKIQLDRQPVDLNAVIRQAAEVCAADVQAKQLRFEVAANDSPQVVWGDATRLQQVFWNLLKNAVKFTPPGGHVQVRCRQSRRPDQADTPAGQQNGWTVVEVIDSGEGIEPHALDRVFNAFEQGTQLTTQQFGGLGLGLAISKSLVQMHGGRIWAESEGKGKGAKFTVQLPLFSQTGCRSAAGAARVEASNPDDCNDHPTGLRVLLVEDHKDTARILERLLTADGHTVTHAAQAATALEFVRNGQFDLMLSDLGLPDGTGHDLMRQVLAMGKQIKGIALSGYGMAADVQKSREAGFMEHLTKPVNYNNLRQTLKRVMYGATNDA